MRDDWRGCCAEPDPEPDDLEALDAAWAEEEVAFGPGAARDACGKDGLAAKLRQARRPAPGLERPPAQARAPIVTHRRQTAATGSLTMRDTIFHILFVWYPYVCLSAFIFGSIIRFDREQYTWRAGSSQMLRKRSSPGARTCFTSASCSCLLGHTVGLLTPKAIYTLFVTVAAEAADRHRRRRHRWRRSASSG